MPAIPDEVVASVKANTSLLSLLSRYDIKVIKRGAKDHFAICPFHKVDGHPEKTPSLSIDTKGNQYHCFSCNAGGDPLKFVMDMENLTFPQAIEKLLALIGNGKEQPAAVSKEQNKPSPKPTCIASEERQSVLREVARRCTAALRSSPEAQAYLESRGFDPLLLLESFTIGYWPPGLFKDLATEEKLKLAALGFATNGSALFDNCLVVPLYKEDGRIATMYGRNITTDSSATAGRHYMLPGTREGLCLPTAGLDPQRPVIITESIIDSLSLFAANYHNALPLLGVNGFLPDHLEYLKRQSFPKIFIALNGDQAGNRAAAELQRRLAVAKLTAAIIELPAEKDINDMLRETGPGKLREWIAEKTGENNASERPTVWEDGVDFWVLLNTHEYRVRGLSPNGMDRLTVNLLARDVNAKHNFYVDRLDLYQSRAREHFIGSAAKQLGSGRDEICSEVNRLIATLEELRLQMKGASDSKKAYQMSTDEEQVALKRLKDPNLLELLADDLQACGMVGNRNNCLLAFLVGLSRLLEKALGLLTVSRSGAGKSFLLEMVAAFTPDEWLEPITKLTGSNLFYKGREGIKRKLLVMEEDEGMKSAMFSVRILLSSQKLHLQGIKHDPQSGELRSFENVVEGPASVFIGTTDLSSFDHETLNRFFVLHLDESPEHTSKIMEQQDRLDTIEGLEIRERRKELVLLHQNMQRLLKPMLVVNPIGTKVKYPPEILHSRREKLKLQNLIKSCALLHQHQREIKEREVQGKIIHYIEVAQEDIDAVLRFAGDILRHSLDDLSPLCRKLLHCIHDTVNEKHLAEVRNDPDAQLWQVVFTRKEIMDRSGWSMWHLREHLKELLELGYITPRSGKQGQQYAYSLVAFDFPEPPDLGI